MNMVPYDKEKIGAGLVIFFVIFTLPFWYNRGRAVAPANPVLPTDYKTCVESTNYMKTSHMMLLNTWRTEVVRYGPRYYTNTQGQRFKMSLTDTCLDCHPKKADFCDRCHNFASVFPYCWSCHLTEKGTR